MNAPMVVMLVDDEASARLTAIAALDGAEYEFHQCDDGPSLLNALELVSPELILLDVEMPGMDGIATCRALREAGYDGVHVIFVSAHDDLPTRLAAYDAGGNDFVVKPYKLDELKRKAHIAFKQASLHRQLGAQALSAHKTAFTAMSSMAEMGCVMDFLRDSAACSVPVALAERLFEALRHYGLACLVKLQYQAEWHYFSSQGECTPIECSIVEHSALLERIFQFHDRMVVNYPAVTLLVSGLPINEPERIGRLRDHLAVMAEGLQIRLQTLDAERVKAMQSRGITFALNDLVQALEDIERNKATCRLRAEVINSNYLHQLTEAFSYLGLSDDQEAKLTRMAQCAYKELAELRDVDSEISNQVRKVVGRLRTLVGGGQ